MAEPMTSDDAFELKSVMQQILAQMKDSAEGTTGAADSYSRRTSELIAHEELSRRATAAATTATNNNTASMKSLASTMASFGKNLEKLGASLNKTQNDFGISLANAGRLQVAAFTSSVKSFMDAFTSINFGQILSGMGDVVSAMGEMTVNVAKDVASGKGPGNALKEGVNKIGAEFAKERPGPAPTQGVTRAEVIEATKKFQDDFGVINEKFGTEIALEAKNRGLSVDQLVQARRVFATTAMGDLNKVAGIQNRFFDQFQSKGMTPKIALEAITKYADLIARNGNRFADSFARAAADAKKIGVDLSKVDQIGDSIISDFEGFLEKSAELGAMGFNLDTNSLAQLAESGDTGALFNELRSQLAATGKDITKLRRSEQLALSGAFGISMADIQRMAGGTPEATSTEDYAKEGNSLLGQILALLVVGGPIFSMLSSGFTGLSNLLGTGSDLVRSIVSLASWLGPAGVIGMAVLAIAAWFGYKTATAFDETNKRKEEAKTAAIGGDYAGAKSKLGEAQMSETMSNMAMMGPEAGMIAPMMAAKERERQQEQINNIYRLQQLSPGNIGPSNPYRGMQSGIDRLPQFAPRATSGDRYNQRLADEAVLRGRELTPPIQRAAGGLVTGPGTDKSDSIPARLSNGEFIINAAAAKKIGIETLHKINDGMIPKFKDGGSVGRISGQPDNTQVNKLLSKITGLFGGNAGKAITKAQEVKTGGVEGLFAMAQNKFGNMFGGNAGKAIAKAQEVKAGGAEGLLSMVQNRFGGMFGGNAGKAMSGIRNLFTGGGTTSSNLMGMATKIPGLGGLLGKATGLLSGGGLKGMAGSLLGKVGLGSLGGSLLGGPMGLAASLAAPLLKKIPLVGGALASIAGGPGKLMSSALGKVGGLLGSKKGKSVISSIAGGPMGMAAPLLKKIPFVGGALASMAGARGKLMGSALGKIGGLLGKKKGGMDLAGMLPPQMQAMLSGGQPGMEGVNFPAMLAQMMGGQQTQQAPAAPVVVDTKGMEEKLNNFIAALQGIQVHMDGTKVGKLLVNINDAASAVGVFGAQSR